MMLLTFHKGHGAQFVLYGAAACPIEGCVVAHTDLNSEDSLVLRPATRPSHPGRHGRASPNQEI